MIINVSNQHTPKEYLATLVFSLFFADMLNINGACALSD